MKNMVSFPRLICLFSTIFLSLLAQAQDAGPEMADELRSNGKIYIVLACVLMVLAGMISFLFVLEKRLSRLEKEQSHEN
jgi:uncharacterized transporter YbjL